MCNQVHVRSGGCLSCIVSAVLLSAILAISTETTEALEPPSRGEIQQYKRDGTLAARLARARTLGNHRVRPEVAARARHRLNQLRQKATGKLPLKDEPAAAPPPAWQGGLPAFGTPRALVLLVDFPEYPAGAGQTASDVENKLFGNGNPAEYPYESLRNFYQRASYNQLTIQGDVLGWYRAQHSRSYYQNLGDGPGQEALMMEALNFFNSQGHDFTQYDNDGDGRIEALFLKWTGPDNGWSNFWWAYQWEWHSNPNYRIDGKSLGSYVWSWIAQPTGGSYSPRVDIHETGHLLGLPDLYDYDGSVGPDGGVGDLDMMDANWGDHNCFSKFMLGWLTPTTIVAGSQTLTLNPSGTSKDCVLIMPEVVPGQIFDEFFMAQYRRRSTGNDPANYPTDGFTIWHIDATLTSSGSDFLYNNSYTSHKLIRLMEADGLEEIELNFGVDSGDFYRPNMTFSNNSTPDSRDYGGRITGVQVDQLGSPGTTMSARFSVFMLPDIQSAGAVISSESCTPGNGFIDPQETVTLEVSLQNHGTGDTTNLTATLLPTGGVTVPSGPQSYGTLLVDGPAVARSFSFIASGACGDTLTATLQLQDQSQSLPSLTFTFPVGAPIIAQNQNFDAVAAPALPAGWTAVAASGAVTPWVTINSTYDTPPNCVFADDVGFVSDNRLDSPPVLITTPTAQLSFRHRFTCESFFDGGVLEIAIGSGGFVDILNAGGSFSAGGYNDIISTSWDNPLAGRKAWSGDSGGFITTTVNLPAAAAGQTVRLRWRLGTDKLVSADGWYVDGVVLNDGYTCCSLSASVGDFDGDGDTDQDDFGVFQRCLTGQSIPQNNPACAPARMDADSDVDQQDLQLFIRCHTAPGIAPDPDCRNP